MPPLKQQQSVKFLYNYAVIIKYRCIRYLLLGCPAVAVVQNTFTQNNNTHDNTIIRKAEHGTHKTIGIQEIQYTVLTYIVLKCSQFIATRVFYVRL